MTGDVPPQPYLDLRRVEIVRRVVAAEALYGEPSERTGEGSARDGRPRESTHGTFGLTAQWDTDFRGPIEDWLAQSADVEGIVRSLTGHTPLNTAEVQGLIDYLRQSLAEAMADDGVADNDRFIETELSERLAAAGILPMFGFPTRVRPLYARPPRTQRDDDTAKVSDRSIEMAVSSFAPVASRSWKDKDGPIRASALPPGPLGGATRLPTILWERRTS